VTASLFMAPANLPLPSLPTRADVLTSFCAVILPHPCHTHAHANPDMFAVRCLVVGTPSAQALSSFAGAPRGDCRRCNATAPGTMASWCALHKRLTMTARPGRSASGYLVRRRGYVFCLHLTKERGRAPACRAHRRDNEHGVPISNLVIFASTVTSTLVGSSGHESLFRLGAPLPIAHKYIRGACVP
jgi:hypothetical protein